MFWCLTVNWMWILCIKDVHYWEIHSSECTGLRSLTLGNSYIFFLQKCKFFSFLEHVECVIFISLLHLSEACINILFVYTWLERLQKFLKGKLHLRSSLQFKVFLIVEEVGLSIDFLKLCLNTKMVLISLSVNWSLSEWKAALESSGHLHLEENQTTLERQNSISLKCCLK